LGRKSSQVQRFRDLDDAIDPGAIIRGLQRGGIAPVEKSVISRQLLAFARPSRYATDAIGPNVARFLVNRTGHDYDQSYEILIEDLPIPTLTGPDHNQITRS